jgi:GT2 family glycosyltransferase
MTSSLITLSIVSHGQSSLIRSLLSDLNKLAPANFEIIITVNIPEDESPFTDIKYPSKILRNKSPRGFGANHNAAFNHSSGNFFVIVNPDIRLPAFNIGLLLESMNDPGVGAVVPVVLSSDGVVQDSVRCFPTFSSLFLRLLLRQRHSDYLWNTKSIKVDWAAGMFVVFRREAFVAVGGFDERRFFMYFEDVDICERLWRCGWSVLLQPGVSVVHDAQRASRRSVKHLRWQLTSAMRFLTKL